jgi:hypothetical protein
MYILYVSMVFNFKFEKFVKICKISITILKYALSCKNMRIQILDLISWPRETNLFRTPLYLTLIKKSTQMLEVPKPINNVLDR